MNQISGVNKNSVELYDDTAGYESDVGLLLTPGLSYEEQIEAVNIYKIFRGLWGLCIIVGDRGMGKDLFGNIISYLIKRYFPQKRILRDEKPRPLYGAYAGLFNKTVMAEDLDRMKAVANRNRGSGGYVSGLTTAADDWVADKGMVLLKNCVLYLVEFWDWVYNRNPHDPMNKTMGAIHKMVRHLDSLIFGSVQIVGDLDKHTCLPFVDWQINCGRSKDNWSEYKYVCYKVKWDINKKRLVKIMMAPHTFIFDGAKPKKFLGDGKIKILRHDYMPYNEDERVLLDVIKSGYDDYDAIVDLLYNEGDMDEDEVLETLKQLQFGRDRYGIFKRVIEYPCWFLVYNSKSAPQIKSSMRVEA